VFSEVEVSDPAPVVGEKNQDEALLTGTGMVEELP
jgi:hypothetical protein